MHFRLFPAIAIGLCALPAAAQEIVEVPASQAGIARPDDVFGLPSGQWYVARQVTQGNEPCTPDGCEAGFTSGDLAVSVEHAKGFVQVIAGFRNCEPVAFAEVGVGAKPGRTARSDVSNLVRKVVKGAEKSCKVKAPAVPKFDAAALFPKEAQ